MERADAARVEPGIMAGNRGGKTLVSVTCDCCQGLTEAGRKVHKLCVETKNKPSDFADLSPVRCSPRPCGVQFMYRFLVLKRAPHCAATDARRC